MKHLSNLYQHKLVMNLQRFGDDHEGDAHTDGDAGDEDEQQNEKTFTRAQMASIIAAEVKKANEEMERKKADEIEQALTEAEELAKLSEDKRNEALLQKERDKFAKEREEFRAEQLTLEKQKQLLAEGMPSTFASRVVGVNAEEILADIQVLKTDFDKAVQEAVNTKLVHSADAPLGGTGNMSGNQNPWSKDSFNLTEQGRITKEDPEKAKIMQQMAKK